jgi:predicted PurR-regulated permease PerM
LIQTNHAIASSRLLTLTAFAVLIVGLYFGRQVLIPLALAVVFAFLLTPVVGWLEKCRLGRVPAALGVLVLAFMLVAFIGWMVSGQLMNVVDQFPSYQSNIHSKIQALKFPDGSRLQNAAKTVTELSGEISAASADAGDKKSAKTSATKPIPVQVAQPPSNAPQYVRAIVGPLTGVLETSAMVVVFTLFVLIKREDLRNRLIRLAGDRQLTIVTQALDDGSRRLSRYLLMLFLVNACYGAIFGLGVYWINVPHALLWGVLAALLRFVPYVGTPIAAIFPMAMAWAVFPTWHQAGIVFVLFFMLEIVIANLLEPWLYGAHTGISSLAILVAAVFWATLWGPLGLILSTPLTVCLILAGRYVPQLSFLEVLLGDEAVLPVETHFYQRLLALDETEANDIADAYLKERPLGSFYDSVLVPALGLAEKDRHLNSLETRTAIFIAQTTRDLVEELGDRHFDETPLFHRDGLHPASRDESRLSGIRVTCIPAADEADELVAIMIAQLLERLGCSVTRLPIASNIKVVDDLEPDRPQTVLISALPPFAAGHARSLCKRLRQKYPDLKIILGLWNSKLFAQGAPEQAVAGFADAIATSLEQVVSILAERNLPTVSGLRADHATSRTPELVTVRE